MEEESYLLGYIAVQSAESQHGAISQKTELFITTAVRILNPTSNETRQTECLRTRYRRE
jgi:hypothetical protein